VGIGRGAGSDLRALLPSLAGFFIFLGHPNAMKVNGLGLLTALIVIVLGVIFIWDENLALDLMGFFLIIWGFLALLGAFGLTKTT
jgi:hypothetical protein